MVLAPLSLQASCRAGSPLMNAAYPGRTRACLVSIGPRPFGHGNRVPFRGCACVRFLLDLRAPPFFALKYFFNFCILGSFSICFDSASTPRCFRHNRGARKISHINTLASWVTRSKIHPSAGRPWPDRDYNLQSFSFFCALILFRLCRLYLKESGSTSADGPSTILGRTHLRGEDGREAW